MSALHNLIRYTPTVAGRVKIGAKGEKAPVKFQGMMITRDRKDDNNFVIHDEAHRILNSIGADNKPKPLFKIPIKIDSDNIENVIFVRKASYQGKTCLCSGDGVDATTKDGLKVNCSDCPKNTPAYKGLDKCKINTTFYFKIVGITPLGKYHTFKTTGWNSTQALVNSIISLWKEGMGRLRGVEFTLTYAEKNVVDFSGMTRKIPVVSIEFDGTEEMLHARIIANSTKEAKYMAEMNQINNFKLNHTSDLFLTTEEAQEFYPETNYLDYKEEQVQEDSFKIENDVSEKSLQEYKEELEALGWTKEELKGKRLNTLKMMAESGEMPVRQDDLEEIQEIEEEEPPVVEEVSFDDDLDFNDL